MAQGARAFGYDAATAKGRRRAPPNLMQSEDAVLFPAARQKLTAASRDITRNFTIAAWMVRKHLDYVSQFGFHSRTGVGGLDDRIESLMESWSEAENCDAAARHSFSKIIRIAEARRTLDGDIGLLKLADGTIQGVEGDRIRNPIGSDLLMVDGARWLHGVRIDAAGKAEQYAVYRRGVNGTGFVFDRVVPASNLVMHGFYERFDQVRGVSPIASALNGMQDIYENFDYALAKAKVSQLFALVFYRDAMGGVDDDEGGEAKVGDDGYPKVSFGGGPVQLDLDPGDRAEFLESSTPSTQFQDFTRLMVMVVLKALDIPYSFWDESHTNFFGSRGAWLHYERSCKDKRDDVLRLLKAITRWRLGLWVQDGLLTLPAGMTVNQVAFEWVPLGMPWWDPSKEIGGDLKAIGAGLDNPQRICKERGRGDYYDNIDRIAEAMDYARQRGVPISFAPGPEPMEVVTANAE